MATSPNYGWLEPDNTDLVKNGALAIRTLGNAIDSTMATMTPKSIVDAKGDLIAATANDTPARLAVGNNGETIVADSSTATGLRWQGDYAAGKNKIINGDFSVNQRSFTSTVNDNTFTFDRWRTYSSGTDQTYSAQTFTPGAAPVAGYEGQSFAQIATVGGAGKFGIYSYRIEDVRTFANQSMTVSFWAKANSGTPKIVVAPAQYFGTGGSATVTPTAQIVTISTSWTRYSVTFSMPSLSGKTIGTGSYLALEWTFNNDYNVNIGQQTNTFQFWGAQAEAGSVATAFQTATGTIQGELAACQRYYFRATASSAYTTFGVGAAYASTAAQVALTHPVAMRIGPSSFDYANLAITNATGSVTVPSSFVFSNTGPLNSMLNLTGATGLSAGDATLLLANNNTAAYIGFSAEL